MEPQSAAMPGSQPERHADTRGIGDQGIGPILKSYFYWTHPRGSIQYDVMVTLILLFIFITPHLWDFGDKPSTPPAPSHPIVISANGAHGVIITVQASDVNVLPGASDRQVKKALRQAIEPVTGDAVFVEHWETVTDAKGNLNWKIWAHK
jgi:hypothetical protein